MKMITYIYIFALYILLTPGFLRKTKLHMQNYLLYSLVFSLVLYLTYDLVNKKNIESYNEYDVDVKGVNSLVDLIKTQFGSSGSGEKKIDIHNQIAGSQGNNNINCWNALGKNQKELEIIKVQLDSFAGTKKDIDKLNNQLNTLKQQVDGLDDKLIGSKGTNKKIDNLNIQIKNYQGEIDKLQQQITLYNETDEDIKKINNQIATLQSEITDLNLKITDCTDLNAKNTTTVNTLNTTIKNQEESITNLQNKISNNVDCPPPTGPYGEKVYVYNGSFAICINGRDKNQFKCMYMPGWSGTLTNDASNLQEAYEYAQKNPNLFIEDRINSNSTMVWTSTNTWSSQSGYWCYMLYNGQPIAAWDYPSASANGGAAC